jgi:Rieske Fe-S protein
MDAVMIAEESGNSACSQTCNHQRNPEKPHNAHLALLPRRSFVRTIALMSAGSWLAGKELPSWFVADIHAQSSGQIGIFRADLNSFPALRNDLGSVRLKVTGMPSSFREIIITKQGPIYHAVSSRCTHEGVTVNPYSITLGAMRCPQHGSLYNPNGSVKQGVIAQQLALTKYNATFDGQDIIAVEIPGLGFSITTTAVLNPSNNTRRLQIDFPSVTGVRYSLRFRASLVAGDWAQIPFATTIDSAATTNELSGNNQKKSIFVDRAEELGFYAVTRIS